MDDIRICHFSSAMTCVHKLLLPRQSESYWWWSPDRAKSPPLALTAALRDFADEKLERKTRHKHHDDVNTFDLTHTYS